MHGSLRLFARLVFLLLAPGYSLAQPTRVPATAPISAQDTVPARSQWRVPFDRGLDVEQELAGEMPQEEDVGAGSA